MEDGIIKHIAESPKRTEITALVVKIHVMMIVFKIVTVIWPTFVPLSCIWLFGRQSD